MKVRKTNIRLIPKQKMAMVPYSKESQETHVWTNYLFPTKVITEITTLYLNAVSLQWRNIL